MVDHAAEKEEERELEDRRQGLEREAGPVGDVNPKVADQECGNNPEHGQALTTSPSDGSSRSPSDATAARNSDSSLAASSPRAGSSSTTRPAAKTTMRVAIATASWRSWVAKRIPVRPSAASRTELSRNRTVASGSRFRVGSSRRRKGGSASSARASERRARMPDE